MNSVKNIPRPEFTSARRLTPMEMNNIRCQKRHTVLTPEQIEKLAPTSKTAVP